MRCSSLVDWPVYPRLIRDYLGGLAVAQLSPLGLLKRPARKGKRHAAESEARLRLVTSPAWGILVIPSVQAIRAAHARL